MNRNRESDTLPALPWIQINSNHDSTHLHQLIHPCVIIIMIIMLNS